MTRRGLGGAPADVRKHELPADQTALVVILISYIPDQQAQFSHKSSDRDPSRMVRTTLDSVSYRLGLVGRKGT